MQPIPEPASGRFPPWLKKRLPTGDAAERVRGLLKGLGLATVCQSARCPNQCECFHQGTAAFMILGDCCTRDCRFCAISHGVPPPPDPTEPDRVAEGALRLGLRYVVVTSVTRDDLPDGGAGQFRETVLALRKRANCRVEVLTPDFQGDRKAVDVVLSAAPDVYNHNIETVPRLYRAARPSADYRRSLDLLEYVKNNLASGLTKSGLMVGMGETAEEVRATLHDLRRARCDLLTIGQYLRPTSAHLPIFRFVSPDEFEDCRREAQGMGFSGVAAGPFVRSSYHAEELFAAVRRTEEED